MLRRLIALFAIVLGLGIIGAAVGSATVWRPADEATAVLPAAPEEPVLVTAPGVLNMVDDEVSVRVVGADEETPLVLAMGHEADVRAWIGTSPYLEVTGLRSWEELEVESGQVSPEPEDTESPDEEATEDGEATEDEEGTEDEEASEDALPNPRGSDLWVEEVTDTGELTYTWTAVPGRWMMLVATDGTDPAPQVELTWTREVETPLLVPGLIVGGIVLLAGIAGLVLVLLVDREAARSRRAREEAALAGAEVPERKAGRHRGDGEDEPLGELLADGDDTSLTYAQRLGWPSATEAGEESAEGASDVAADADTAASVVPTAPDGTPLTRRQIREAEQARLAEERRGSKRRRGRGAKESAAGENAELAASEESADSGAHDSAGTDESAATTEQAPTADAGQEHSGLSEWVASGRSGQEAGPIETYPVAAPGAAVTGAAGTDAAGTDAESQDESPGEERNAADDAPAGPKRRGTWWHPLQRRRRDTDEDETPGRRRSWRREEWAAAPVSGADAADEGGSGVSESSEQDPHASGALWRKTWGIAPAESQSHSDQNETGNETETGTEPEAAAGRADGPDGPDDSTEEGSR